MAWCIEVKEKADALKPLLDGMRRCGRGIDGDRDDRNDDPLRKAKYLVRRRPPYFSLVAIGCRLDFSVTYTEHGFSLTEDLVPIA